jgi:hypothetical protein
VQQIKGLTPESMHGRKDGVVASGLCVMQKAGRSTVKSRMTMIVVGVDTPVVLVVERSWR